MGGETFASWRPRLRQQQPAELEKRSSSPEKEDAELSLPVQVASFPELENVTRENREALEGIRRILGKPTAGSSSSGIVFTNEDKLRELDRLMGMAKVLDEMAFLKMEDNDEQRKELELPQGAKAYYNTIRTGLCIAYLAASVVASSLVRTSKAGDMGMAGEAVKVLSSAVPVVGGLANFSAAALRVGHRHVQTRRVVEITEIAADANECCSLARTLALQLALGLAAGIFSTTYTVEETLPAMAGVHGGVGGDGWNQDIDALPDGASEEIVMEWFAGEIANDDGKQTSKGSPEEQVGIRLGKQHLQKLLMAVGRGCLRGTNTTEEKVERLLKVIVSQASDRPVSTPTAPEESVVRPSAAAPPHHGSLERKAEFAAAMQAVLETSELAAEGRFRAELEAERSGAELKATGLQNRRQLAEERQEADLAALQAQLAALKAEFRQELEAEAADRQQLEAEAADRQHLVMQALRERERRFEMEARERRFAMETRERRMAPRGRRSLSRTHGAGRAGASGAAEGGRDNRYDRWSTMGRNEELTVPEPVYSAMPQGPVDDRRRVDASFESPSPAVRPDVQRRTYVQPSESEATAASTPAARSRQLKATSMSSGSTSISGASGSFRMHPQGGSKLMNGIRKTSRWKTSRWLGVAGPRKGGLLPAEEPVVFSCFAPPAVRPGISFILKVSAYLKRRREAALRRVLSEGRKEAGRPEGMSIAKGTRLTVHLFLPEDAFKLLPPLHSTDPSSVRQPSVRDFVWTGEDHAVDFRVGCLPGAAPGRVSCEAMVIDGSRVKLLTFAIEVAEPGFAPRVLDGGSNGEVELDTVIEEERGNVAEIPYEELVFVRELGGGVQGITSHCRWRDNDVAVKSLASMPGFEPSRRPTRSGLEHEASILSLLGRHPNIVEFYGLSRQGGGSNGGDEGSIHVVTKLAEGGSIEAALGVSRGKGNGGPMNGGRFAATMGGSGTGSGSWNRHGSGFDGDVRAAWAGDIALGLANSHAAGVLHNDVASRNALLSTPHRGSHGLLCDFGISRLLRGGVEAASLIDTDLDDNTWPVLQMPRESLVPPFPLTAESDSWMYGLFLYEVFEGRQPWAGLDKHEARRLVMEGRRPPKVPEMLKDRGTHMVKLYQGCLSADSAKRPTLEQVVQHFRTRDMGQLPARPL